MPEVFDGERIRPVQQQVQHQADAPAGTPPDREVTLGPKLLLGVALGLVLLGSLCFGLGYVMGSHSHASSLNGQQPSALTVNGSASKPSAADSGAFQPQRPASSPSSSDGSDSAAAPQTPDADASQPAEAPAGQSAPASDR